MSTRQRIVTDMPMKDRPLSEQYRLTFLREMPPRQYPSGSRRQWLMRCACGTEKIIEASRVKRGIVRSCGCLQAEIAASVCRTHGLSHTPEHGVWVNMIRRCHDQADKSYPRYGALGITVCDAWREDFASFYSHVGPRPTPDHSIERMNGTRGYEPGNVRWATVIEQNRNRKSVHKINHDGRVISLAEYCHETGLSRATVDYRIGVIGLSIDEAVSLESRRKGTAIKRKI